MSASGRLLGDDHDETTEEDRHLASSESEKAVMQGEEHGNFSSMPGEMWGGVPDYSSITERRRCFLNLTQKGATWGICPQSALAVVDLKPNTPTWTF